MNSKILVLVTALFVLSVLANLYFLLGNSAQLSSPNNTVKLPLSINHQGITSQVLVYNFSGKITKITPVGNDIRLTLDISDSSMPDFLITKDTKIFRVNNSNPNTPPVPATISDLQIDSSVTFGMLYELKNKTWQLGALSIVDTTVPSLSPVSPTPSTSSQTPTPTEAQ